MVRPSVDPAVLCLKTEPGLSSSGHTTVSSAPTDASVTASIVDDNGLLSLELIAFEPFSRPLTAEEIAELPPFPPSIRAKAAASGSVVEYQETGRTDGATPLDVTAGDMVQALVAFSASAQPAPDTTSANLILEAPGWERTEMPVFLLIGKPITVPTIEPLSIHRAAEPGETLIQDVVIADVPAAAKLIAFVKNGGAVIRLLHVAAYRPVKKKFSDEEIEELSHYPPWLRTNARRDGYIEYQETARSDGRLPVPVLAGQLVRLYLEFAAPLQDFPDVTVGNLTVDAAMWQRSEIPVSLIIGKITVAVSPTAVTVRQGESAELNLSVASVAGPATAVDFELGMNPDMRWEIDPPSIHLPKGATVDRASKIKANFNAPLGTYPVGLEARCFDRLQLHRLPFELTVKPARVFARFLETAIIATQGDKVTCHLEVTSEGGRKSIGCETSMPPTGVRLTPTSYSIGPEPTTAVIPLEFAIDPEAPAVTSSYMALLWSAGDGENGGLLALSVTINLKPNSRTFHQAITTPTGTALGGWAELTIRSNGTYRFRGHMHGSGLDPYAFRISAVIRSVSGNIRVAAMRSGRVGGTFGGGSRDYDWDEDKPHPFITKYWSELKTGTAEFGKWYEDTGVLGALDDIATAVAEFLAINAVGGPLAAAAIVVGSELGALTEIPFAHPSLLAGAAVAGGVVLLFGPGLVFPALVAGAAAGAQLQSRALRESEKQLAIKVFGDTLPINRIRMTNLTRAGRKFCLPHVDGSILLGMGDAEEDPLRQADWRKSFVHELTHAWQIAHRAFLAEMIWEGAINEVEGRTAAYTYALDGRPWSGYGIEQQASMVGDWYTLYEADLNSDLSLQSPWFPYIQNNIRLGQP